MTIPDNLLPVISTAPQSDGQRAQRTEHRELSQRQKASAIKISWRRQFLGLNRINGLVGYIRAYKNWPMVTFRVITGKTPISAKLRTGEVRTHYSSILPYFEVNHFPVRQDVQAGAVELCLEHQGRQIRLRIQNRNWGDLPAVFFLEDYKFISGCVATVVDVGANIGDSSIYFALHGAMKVIAIEPFPSAFALLQLNTCQNGLSSVIKPVQAALGKKEGAVRLSPSAHGLSQRIRNSRRGLPVVVTTLDNIAEKYHIIDGFLKLDCEGAEEEIIMSASRSTLRVFKRIQIESNQLPTRLVQKLSDSGFRVELQNSRHWNDSYATSSWTVRYICAERV